MPHADRSKQREINFCRRCGTTLNKISEEYWKCKNQHSTFNSPVPATGIFFLTPNKQSIVLSRRKFDPNKGLLDCVGGFMEINESAEDAVRREITEETELTQDHYSTPIYLCSAPSNYYYQGENIPVISTLFWAVIHEGVQLKPHDDVAEIVTLSPDEISFEMLSGEDIKQGFAKLKEIL